MPLLFNEKRFKSAYKTASWDIARTHKERPNVEILKNKAFIEGIKKEWYSLPYEYGKSLGRSFYPYAREVARNIRKTDMGTERDWRLRKK